MARMAEKVVAAAFDGTALGGCIASQASPSATRSMMPAGSEAVRRAKV
jgi:hypothetical protein